ncbi:MAG: hypothetical protein ACRCTQ_05170 [Brevinemataceae bacterium]
MDDRWKYKVEQDIQSLAQSISRLSLSLENFIEYSKEMQNEKFTKINEMLCDHEKRIRFNTRFIYQTIGIISMLILLLDFVYKFKIL